MRTHLGCTGSVDLGRLSEETRCKLERVAASWLEYLPGPPSLVVRHVQPDDTPALREIAGELLEFLSEIPEPERGTILGGAFFYQDEQSGQYVRLKVWEGGFLTVAWARPDYERAQSKIYQGQAVSLVFEPFQRLNGKIEFQADPVGAEKIHAVLENFSGLSAQGEYEIFATTDAIRLILRDVNASALSLLKALRSVGKPGSLDGEIDVSSFRTGDLEDYCRFVLRGDETWLVRPSLWSDVPETTTPIAPSLERAA